MTEIAEPVGCDADYVLPAIPVSAGALIFDRKGRLLILKPTYKSGWTIPGGVMEADGETPWQACQREVREECGLEIASGRLACMDFRRPRPSRPGGIRFLFDCGSFSSAALRNLRMQPEEISEHKLAPLPEALKLLRGPIRRRVKAAVSSSGTVYLEQGRPVPTVRPCLKRTQGPKTDTSASASLAT
jgi:8-oxo-dGTP diphosphatase